MILSVVAPSPTWQRILKSSTQQIEARVLLAAAVRYLEKPSQGPALQTGHVIGGMVRPWHCHLPELSSPWLSAFAWTLLIHPVISGCFCPAGLLQWLLTNPCTPEGGAVKVNSIGIRVAPKRAAIPCSVAAIQIHGSSSTP